MNLADFVRELVLPPVLETRRQTIRAAANRSEGCAEALFKTLIEELVKYPALQVETGVGHRVTVRAPGETDLTLQVTAFATGYGNGGKTVTGFIDDLVADLEHLQGNLQAYVAWVAYPIPEGQRQWEEQLARVKKAGGGTEEVARFAAGPFGDACVYWSRA